MFADVKRLKTPTFRDAFPMPYSSLRDFMDRLERSGRLVRVKTPVSPVLEMTEIHTRLLAQQGPAVLFENVVRPDGTRSEMPVLINLFGTVERVAWGMDREPHELRQVGETLAFLKQPEPPGGFREALEMIPLLKTVLAMKPKTVGSAPCQEVVLHGDQGADRQARGRLQPGHLPHAGAGEEPHHHALAEASWRRPAAPALETGRQTGAAARLRGDRRRPRHHPRRGHAGAGHAVGISV